VSLQESQQTAIALAGTVPLPSPFPASGPISVVLIREDGDWETYIKIVQVVSLHRIVTRFVRRADIRAIRAPAGPAPHGGPESWPIRKFKHAQAEIDAREQTLRAGAKDPGTPAALELDWHAEAIVYVPEGASVLHRVEVGVTAAVSAEDVGFAAAPAFCCHAAPIHPTPWSQPHPPSPPEPSIHPGPLNPPHL
jgi:hypothetical protein